jgi:hypothetical protein
MLRSQLTRNLPGKGEVERSRYRERPMTNDQRLGIKVGDAVDNPALLPFRQFWKHR